SLSPSSATAGGAGFALTVNGSNFSNASTILWNGSARTTTFVSATQLTAAILASDIVTGGSAQVTVSDSFLGTSNAVTFMFNNPAPAITSLSPSSTSAGGAAFTLTVNGTGFVAASV